MQRMSCTNVDPRDRLIVALDAPSLGDARALAGRLSGAVRWLKVGSALYTAEGPAAVSALVPQFRVFLDLKFHDIPAQVAAAPTAAATWAGMSWNFRAR